MREPTLRQFVDELVMLMRSVSQDEPIFPHELASWVRSALINAEEKADERRRLLTKRSDKGDVR